MVHVMTHTLVNFSLRQSSAGDLGPAAGAGGSGLVSLLSHVIRVSYVRAITMCIIIIVIIIIIMCAAPPIIICGCTCGECLAVLLR